MLREGERERQRERDRERERERPREGEEGLIWPQDAVWERRERGREV